MSMGQDAKLPSLEVYRVDSEIPIAEASGTLAVNGDNLLILGSYIDPDDYILHENFDGADVRLSSSFQTIGANSELKLNNAWFAPDDAPTPWFGGGGFLGMGSNTVEENIRDYFCLQSIDKDAVRNPGTGKGGWPKPQRKGGGGQNQCYVKPLNPNKLKGFWIPRYDRRGKKEKWSVYKPYWKWNDIRGRINFAPPGEVASEGIGAAVEEPKEITENNTIFNDMVMTSNQSNPYTVPSDIPLLFSEANLDSSVGGSDGKSMRVYHVWSVPPDDGWDSNTLRKVENLWSSEGSNRPQSWKGTIFNVPKPGIIDMGNYPIAYGQIYADNTQSIPKFALSGIHSGTNDNRLSLPEINMRVNFKKMAPALAVNYAYATGTTSDSPSSYGGPWGNMNIYYSGSGKHNKKLPDSLEGAFGTPDATTTGSMYFGRFASPNYVGTAAAYSLYTLQRAVCITFSNYKPTEEYLDDFLHNAMTNFYISGQKSMVGGAYFISFNDFETVANTGSYNTSQSRALGFEPRGQAYDDGQGFPVMEPDRVYAFPLPMHPTSGWDHSVKDPTVANSGANFRDGAGMGSLGATDMTSDEIERVRDANPGAKEAYPQIVVSPGVNPGNAGGRASNTNFLSVPKDSWVDLKFVFDPYAVADTSWASGDVGAGGQGSYMSTQFNKETGQTTGPLRMYAIAGERYRVGWNHADPAESELNDVPFINIAFPCTSSLQFLDSAGATTGTSCCHSDCWGEYYLASGTKNDSLWPKHMTIWVNNYRWTRGTTYGETSSNEPYLDNSWAAEDLTQGISSLYQWSDYILQPKGGDKEVEFLMDDLEFSYFNNVKTNSSPAVGDLKSFIKISEGKALTAKSPLSMQPQMANADGPTGVMNTPPNAPLYQYGLGYIRPWGQGPYTIGSGGTGIITEPKWSVVLSGAYGDDTNEGVTVSGAAYRQSFTELCTGAAASNDTIWVTGNQFGDNTLYGSYQRDASWVQVGMSVSGANIPAGCEVTAVDAGAGSGEITIDPVFTGADFLAGEIEFGPGSTGIDTLGLLKLEMWDPDRTSLNPHLGGAGYTTNSGSIGAPRVHKRTISIPFTGTVTTPPNTIDLFMETYSAWSDTWPRYNASGNFVSRPTGYNLLIGLKDKDDIPYGSGTANKASRWGHFLWNTYHTNSWVDISSSRDVVHPTNAFLSLVQRDYTTPTSGTAMWNARALEGLGNQLGPYQLLSYYASQSTVSQGPVKPFANEYQPYQYSGGSWTTSPWNKHSGSALSGSYFSVTSSAGDWPSSGTAAGSDGGALWMGSGSNNYYGTDGLTQKGLTPFIVQDMPGATGTLNKAATGSHQDTTNKFTNWAKREHILASAKVLAGPDMSAFSNVSKTELADNNYIMVDDASIFSPDADDEYIMYILGERMSGTDIYSGTASSVALGFSKSLKLRDTTPVNGNVVFFNIPVTYMDDGSKIGGADGSFEKWIDQLYISPKRYWLHIPYFGSDRDYDFPLSTSAVIPDSLADATGASYDRTYEAIASIKAAGLTDPSGAEAFDVTGSTYNESIYTYNAGVTGAQGMSGVYEHPWVLEPGTGGDSSLILSEDYGFGTYDGEEGTGGQLSKTTALLNTADSISRYVEFPLTGFISGAQDLAPSDTLNMTLRSWDTTANQEVTLHGDDATNEDYRPDIIWRFHDDIPQINEFTVTPAFDTLAPDINLYELTTENLNAVRFNWSTESEDSWYNMLYISNEDIINKYHGALCYLPMNEPPTTIGDVPLTYFYTSGLNTSGSIGTGAAADMRAKIEGLAGYAIKAEAGGGYLDLPPSDGYTATTGSKWLTGLTEFTLVQHIVPNYDLYIGGSNDDEDATIWRQDVTGAASGASLYLEGYKPVFDICNQSVTSSTILNHDGITPASIIITYKSGSTDKKDLKMYVNGQLEDYLISITSGSVSTVSGTQFGFGFYGLMEEFILYDKAYKIVDNDEYILNTGDISEYNSGFTTNKSHNARLFSFDYHNIRGKSQDEVATSNQISWRTTTI